MTAHTKVLGIIDSALLPAVMDADLRTELESSRATVAMHLEDATTIESALAADSGADAVDADAAP